MIETDFIEALDAEREISFSADAPAAARTIDGKWLGDALTSRAKCAIRIEGATITGLDIHSITVGCTLLLKNCSMEGIVADYCTFNEWLALKECSVDVLRFRGCLFKRALWIRNSTVARQVDLCYATIDRDLNLDDTHISGDCYAVGLRVGCDLNARFARFDSDLNLGLSEVTGQLDFNGSVVQGQVTLVDATLGGLTGRGTTLVGPASFDRVAVESTCFLNATTFCSSAYFAASRFEGQFSIEDSTFEGDAFFEGLVANDVFARNCVFRGEVSMVGAAVFSATFDGSNFLKAARLHDTRTEAGLSFSGVQFDGACQFDRIQVKATLQFAPIDGKQTTFAGKLSLAGAHIGAQLNFHQVIFADYVTLEAADVGAELFMTDCRLVENLVIIASHIKGNAEFTGSRFDGSVDLTNSSVGQHCLLWRTHFEYAPDLIRATIGSSLNFTDARLKEGVNLDYASVSGRTVFSGTKISGMLSAKMASLRTVIFDKTLAKRNGHDAWPFQDVLFSVTGLRYDSMDVQWEPFAEALSRRSQRLDRQPFIELERMLRTRGHDDWADDVYYLGRKQASQAYSWASGARIGDFFSRAISGYGVRPIWLFFWIAALVAATTLFYSVPGAARPTSVAAKRYHCDRSPAVFQALGLGLSSLSPGDLKIVDGWTMSDCSMGIFRIKPFTIVGIFQGLGVILIPFLIAQLTALWRYTGRRA